MQFERMFDVTPETEQALLIETQPGQDGKAVIVLTGELDAPDVNTLTQAVRDVVSRRTPSRLEIDLRDVVFLGSAGIRALLVCHDEAGRQGCRLTLTNPGPMPLRVLEITDLLDYFGVA